MMLLEKSSLWKTPSQNASKGIECLGLGILFDMTVGHLSRMSVDRTSPIAGDQEGLISNGVIKLEKTPTSHLQQQNDMHRTGTRENALWNVMQGEYTIPMQDDECNYITISTLM